MIIVFNEQLSNVDHASYKEEFNIFLNPFIINELNIKFDKEINKLTVKLYDLRGKLVIKETFKECNLMTLNFEIDS